MAICANISGALPSHAFISMSAASTYSGRCPTFPAGQRHSARTSRRVRKIRPAERVVSPSNERRQPVSAISAASPRPPCRHGNHRANRGRRPRKAHRARRIRMHARHPKADRDGFAVPSQRSPREHRRCSLIEAARARRQGLGLLQGGFSVEQVGPGAAGSEVIPIEVLRWPAIGEADLERSRPWGRVHT